MKTLVAIIGGLTLVSGAAFAGDDASPKSFEELDKDQNGALTQAEASADRNLVAVFDQADANKDGYLTPTEFDQVMSETEDAE